MSSSSRGIAPPLDWCALVAEAIRRRKEEKLTQRAHAALANVSIPTIVAFDHGERTLTLAKAFDILRVVGLIDEPADGNAQERFVEDAFARWRELTAALPADSPGRFPHGWCRVDYALEGELKQPTLPALMDMLREAMNPHPGWPLFRVPARHESAPREVDGMLECWTAPHDGDADRVADDAARYAFWRAAPAGRIVLIRGYREDAQETFRPGTILDTILPIWHLGEVLLHAASLAALMRHNPDAAVTIHLRVLYTGLNGRVLRAWANPLSELLVEGTPARSDEAMLEASVPAGDIPGRLAHHLFPLIASLYERFGVTGLSERRVQAEVERLPGSRSSRTNDGRGNRAPREGT